MAITMGVYSAVYKQPVHINELKRSYFLEIMETNLDCDIESRWRVHIFGRSPLRCSLAHADNFIHKSSSINPNLTFYIGNQAALRLAQNDISGYRTTHIEIIYNIVPDEMPDKHVNTEYCPTSEVPVEILTNPLSRISLERCLNECGLKRMFSVRYCR